MPGYLIDTSVFVAAEAGRPLGPAPAGDARVSVATLTELAFGVARSAGVHRELREATLARARRFVPLVYDEAVGDQLAAILAAARTRRRRAGAMDAIIAATAIVHDLAVWTQDDDFDVLAALAPALRVARG